jgi:4-diphosphocytidyl-2-C-methyl-D-erythritol kinase
LTVAEKIVIRAQAKINLGLTVLGRRPDGFHQLESIMQQVSLADFLHLEGTGGSEILFQCTDPALAGSDNLVLRAADKLKSLAGAKVSGVKIILYKNIPVEAGLAGGSADAAAALIGLNLIWQLKLSSAALMEAGAELGSDVPFCLVGGTALAKGRGEIVEKLPPCPFFWVVLALPQGAKVSTAAAYGAYDRNLDGQPSLEYLIRAIKSGDRKGMHQWMTEELTNTLATANLADADSSQKLKADLSACGLQPQLSGSGPTLFMLFDSLAEACRALRAVEQAGAKAYLCWTDNKNGSDNHV